MASNDVFLHAATNKSKNITSGKGIHISGAKVIGKSIIADIGGNFSIESSQDTKLSVSESSNKGVDVS